MTKSLKEEALAVVLESMNRKSSEMKQSAYRCSFALCKLISASSVHAC